MRSPMYAHFEHYVNGVRLEGHMTEVRCTSIEDAVERVSQSEHIDGNDNPITPRVVGRSVFFGGVEYRFLSIG